MRKATPTQQQPLRHPPAHKRRDSVTGHLWLNLLCVIPDMVDIDPFLRRSVVEMLRDKHLAELNGLSTAPNSPRRGKKLLNMDRLA